MPYGNFYVGKEGFLYKKSGAIGNRRIFSLGLICNQPTDINNKYVSGSGVLGAVSSNNYAIRRKMIRNSATCINNSCSINYFYLGYPLSKKSIVTEECSILLPRDTQYQVCSPFPFWGGLYNNNRRLSPFIGSKIGNLKWSTTLPSSVNIYYTPVISKDGTIYVADADNNLLYAVSKNGNIKWSLSLPLNNIALFSNITIGYNNRIYVASLDGIYSIVDNETSGILKGISDSTGYITSNILISSNSKTLYVVNSQNYLVGINQSTGALENFIQLSIYNQFFIPICGIAVGSDGTIYVSTNIDNTLIGKRCGLFAVNPNFTLKWSYADIHDVGGDIIGTFGNPSIANDGTIYFVTSYFTTSGNVVLYAMNPNGTNKWQCTLTTNGGTYSSPSIGNSGHIYVPVYYDSTSTSTLFSVKTDGTVLWSIDLDNVVILSSCLVDADETIYLSSLEKMYAISSTNNIPYIKWQKVIGDTYSSPTIDSDGTVYSVSGSGNLYAFN